MNNKLTEKEKMLLGLGYYPLKDKTLESDRLRCKKLCAKYNSLDYDDASKMDLLKQILGKTEEKVVIEPYFWCDYGYNIEVGKDFYSNHNLVILDCAKVTFGSKVLIGPNCAFYTAEHPLNVKDRDEILEYAYPISVGNSVWIGGGTTVLAGVSIGNNSVIGAGSVVTKDIPDNVVAVGNPCKIIKTIEN